ncbi:SDR family NAD(P)-dependent oxidoreductase [Nocardia sp. NPDC057668]|uniref:type I polyketide synthase n=1 Tax=Nocardia sp. NPDC057668 TaxID=3346202 RepID=UPI0036704828
MGLATVITLIEALGSGIAPPYPAVGGAAWSGPDHPRRVVVPQSGSDGAYLVLEQAPPTPPIAPVSAGLRVPLALWPLSGHTPEALTAQAERLAHHVRTHPEFTAREVGHALTATRTDLAHRAVVLGKNTIELLGGLSALAEHRPRGPIRGTAVPRRVVFVFPGQGPQYAGMAVRLMAESPVFAAKIAECEAALSEFVDWSLTAVLHEAEGAPSLERIDVVQPALFATMVSLAALWRSFGIEPAAVLGHSQGEIAAAYVAGALTLSDAARVVALRSKLLRELDGTGGMASIGAPVARVRELLAGIDDLYIAAINSPSATVVAGAIAGVDRIIEACDRDKIRARRVPASCAGHTSHVDSLRERLDDAMAPITAIARDIVFFSTTTGGALATEKLGPDYWFGNMRDLVRFEEGVLAAASAGYDAFLEISVHPVLTAAVHESLGPAADSCLVVDSLERADSGLRRLLSSVSRAHVGGVSPDWSTIYPRGSVQSIPLPPYAFQRRTYRPNFATGGGGATRIAADTKLSAHPLLSDSIEVPGTGNVLFRARVSPVSHPWLADYSLRGTPVLPSTALLEFALHAGEQLGVPRVERLIVHSPVALPVDAVVEVQVVVGDPRAGGKRAVSVYSRPADADRQARWSLQAEGALGPASGSAGIAGRGFGVWPPVGADRARDLEAVDADPAALGQRLGPLFQGLRTVWRRAEEFFAEVELPSGSADSTGYCLHPALMDAAVRPVVAAVPAEVGATRLPVQWEDVELRVLGVTAVRARLTPAGVDRFAWSLADPGGRVVAEGHVRVGAFDTAAIDTRAIAGRPDSRYRVGWLPLPVWRARYSSRLGDWAVVGPAPAGVRGEPGLRSYSVLDDLYAAVASGVPVPPVVVLSRVAGESVVSPVRGLRDELGRTLVELQTWLADERFADTSLIVLTRGVHAVEATDDAASLIAPAVAALVRSAQSEHRGRIVQVDIGAGDIGLDQLTIALRAAEPEIVVRDGEFFGRRLLCDGGPAEIVGPPGDQALARFGSFEPDRTVLITGGTGTIGAIIARHLVAAHGAKHLLLLGRSGAAAVGITELATELKAAGAHVSVAACDVSDRDALARVIADVPPSHPVGAVVHIAATLADATFAALTPGDLDAVLPAKAAAAWYLHELTRDMDLSVFALFSSAAGTFGTAGQANYAAANVFLDELARYRHRAGLPATALAWGWWGQETANTAGLDDRDRARLGRMGITPIPTSAALSLFDDALRTGEPCALPIGMDVSVLRAAEPETELPPFFHALPNVRPRGSQQVSDQGTLGARLAGLTPEAQHEALIELVREPVAMVCGYATPEAVQPDRQFADMGLDSLNSIELGARIRALTGVKLGNAVIFQYPTVRLLAGRVLEQITPRTAELAAPIVAEIEMLFDRLSVVHADAPVPAELVTRLGASLSRLRPQPHGPAASRP